MKPAENNISDVPVCKDKLFEKQRELYYLKQDRSALRRRLKERSMFQKYAPYIAVFLCMMGVEFIRNWMGAYFMELPTIGPFVIILFILIFFDIRREKVKKDIYKRLRANAQQCEKVEREILELRSGQTIGKN